MLIEASAGEYREELVRRYLKSKAPDLRDLIVVRYTSMVRAVARRYAPFDLVDDLVQVGFIGLLKALSKFDPNAGVRFNTYASHFVSGEIRHHLRDRGHTIRQPSWLQELRYKMKTALFRLQAQLKRVPSNLEIAEDLGVSEDSVDEVFAADELLKLRSLDTTVDGSEDSTTEIERLDGASYSPEQLGLEDRMVLENAMKDLRDLEKQVLGLYHFEGLNQTAIAKQLGISGNYVGHILRNSLTKISKALALEEHRDQILRSQSSGFTFEVIDDETGAYTEEYFRNRLQEEVHRASSNDESAALVIVQFKGLEGLGNFYGKRSVSDFLTEVSDFLRASFRRLDVVCRYGKAGFAVILPSTGSGSSIVRDRLIDQTASWTKDRLAASGGVTVQIGTSWTPKDGKSPAQLLAAAIPSGPDLMKTPSQAASAKRDVRPQSGPTAGSGLRSMSGAMP